MPSAKEVEQFGYCAHNWWLARSGSDGKGDASRRGMAQHNQLGAGQSVVEAEKKEYRRAIAWAFRGLGLAASATFLTLEVLFLRASNYHWIFLTIALVLVAGSGGLLVLGLTARDDYKRHQREAGLVPGRLLATDLAQQGAILTDPAWGLSGRPDYVLQTHGGATPIEVKSGHTPPHPHHSHALQLASYLRLLEVANGKRPEYGILQYPDGVFRVDWTPALEADLKATLERMRQAETAGKADRDHEQAGRCRGCARRDACDQKLA
jgi:CRISPR-associated exonuclease Cas4